MDKSLQLYEQALVEARTHFSRQLQPIVHGLNANTLPFFLLMHVYNSQVLLRHMRLLLRGAARKSRRLGYYVLNEQLTDKRQKAKHDMHLLIQDRNNLLAWFKRHLGLEFSQRELSRLSQRSILKPLRALYRDALKSKKPFAIMAMDYELYRINLIHGYTLLKLCQAHWGERGCARIDFLRRQMRMQEQQNLSQTEAFLQDFIRRYPSALLDILPFSKEALDRYAAYIQGCYEQADRSRQLPCK